MHTQVSIRRGGRQIRGARPQCGEGDCGLARQAAHGSCHEAGALLVTGDDHLDAALAHGVHEVQVLLP